MRVLLVTPQLSPYSGITPAGEACWALAKALRGLSHEVTILSPLYGFVDPSKHGLARRLRKVEATLGDTSYAFEVYDTRTAAGIDLMFLGQEELFRPVTDVDLGDGDAANARRYLAFCHGAVQIALDEQNGHELVHGHDWPAGPIAGLLAAQGSALPTVLTVHDATRHGVFAEDPGLPGDLRDDAAVEGGFSFLAAGLRRAGKVTTVSPAYAEAMAADGAPLASLVSGREDGLVGIVGGVDVAVWNPATDPHLTKRFDAMDRSGKRRGKASLQSALDLPVRDDVPLVACVGPVQESAGLDALARISARLLRNDVQLVVLDEDAGDPELVKVFGEHQARWPDRMQARDEAGVELLHRALATADGLLVPRAAPGSDLAMRAHRYGTLPVGPREGAFGDSVVDADGQLRSGSGFLFDGHDDDALLGAAQRLIAGFTQRDAFERMVARVMRLDHGWERAAYHFDRLYRALR